MFPSFTSAYASFLFGRDPKDEGRKLSQTFKLSNGFTKYFKEKTVTISLDTKDSVSVGAIVWNSTFGKKKK